MTIRTFIFIFLTNYAFGQGVFTPAKDYSLTPTLNEVMCVT